jgi:outer membrane biosynthesis protein TonB
MRGARKFAVLLLALLALLSGCNKKKPPVPAPQEQAPTITTQPPEQPQPEAQPQPPPPEPETSVQPPPATAPTSKAKPKRSVSRKTQPPPPPPKDEKKAVVKDGGSEGNAQLAADLPPGEAMHQRQTTAQLRTSTENSLRDLTRALSNDEQSIVQQIRSYMQQSRAAETDGDTERAYNLALKAHLLCDELVKK